MYLKSKNVYNTRSFLKTACFKLSNNLKQAVSDNCLPIAKQGHTYSTDSSDGENNLNLMWEKRTARSAKK